MKNVGLEEVGKGFINFFNIFTVLLLLKSDLVKILNIAPAQIKAEDLSSIVGDFMILWIGYSIGYFLINKAQKEES